MPITDGQSPDPARAQKLRQRLVEHLEDLGDVSVLRVRDALLRVPRHLFVPQAPLLLAYANGPLPIGHGQTISQPTVVAMMTEALELEGTEKVLEIGTGSGYQAAVLSMLCAEVYTIENVPELGDRARALLSELGYANVHARVADGRLGWPEQAPFDRILTTAASAPIPTRLFEQLAEGGVLVGPVGGSWSQNLLRYRKVQGKTVAENLGPVAFVPMTTGVRDD